MSICYQSETLIRADNQYLRSLSKEKKNNIVPVTCMFLCCCTVAILLASLTLPGSLALEESKTQLF